MSADDTTRLASGPRGRRAFAIGLALLAGLVLVVFLAGVATVYVVTRNYKSLHHAAAKGDTLAVRCFLLRGGDPNVRVLRDLTPLHSAVIGGHLAVTTMLVRNGADIDARTGPSVIATTSGWTPLLIAVLNNHCKVAELLIESGANVHAREDGGLTALHVAASAGYVHLAQLLIDHGANVNADDLRCTPRPEYAVFVHQGPDALLLPGTQLVDWRGKTPLDHALRRGHDDVAELLRRHGAGS